jgi:hypothetical protein
VHTWESLHRREQDERKEGHAEVHQEHYRDRQEVQGIHGPGTSRDEGARPRAKGGSAPALSPKLWYGMPAYAKDGKVLCFFQSAQKFNSRYATFSFNDEANLDEGAMWATSFALKELTATEEARIGALVKRAVS